MIDAILTWFGRIWIAAGATAMVLFFFTIDPALTRDWALFHIGWVPMFAIPNPVDIAWWIATLIVISPGAGALYIRNKLRHRKAVKASRTTRSASPT